MSSHRATVCFMTAAFVLGAMALPSDAAPPQATATDASVAQTRAALRAACREFDELTKAQRQRPDDEEALQSWARAMNDLARLADESQGSATPATILELADTLAACYSRTHSRWVDAVVMSYVAEISGHGDEDTSRRLCETLKRMETNATATGVPGTRVRAGLFLMPPGESVLRDADVAAWRAFREHLESHDDQFASVLHSDDADVQRCLTMLASHSMVSSHYLRRIGLRRSRTPAQPARPPAGAAPQGNLAEAMEEFVREKVAGLAKAPNDQHEIERAMSQLWSHRDYLAENYERLPNYDEVVAAFGDDGPFEAQVLDLYYRAMALRKAPKDFKEVDALLAETDDTRLLYFKAYLLMRKGMTDEPVAIMETILERNPNDRRAKALIERMRREAEQPPAP